MAKQRNLFENDPDPWVLDDLSERLVAEVVFAGGTPQGRFDYEVPDQLMDRVQPGVRLLVPLGRGNRPIVAYCLAVATKASKHKLKPVREVIDDQRLLSDPMLRLTQWIAETYLCPLGQVLETVVPAGVRGQAGTRMTTLLHVATDARKKLPNLKLTAKQTLVMKVLGENQPMTAADLMRAAKVTASPIDALKRKGLISARSVRMGQTPEAEVRVQREKPLVLNDDQRAALGAIVGELRAARHETLLVHGVTGSGKTEVYIQAIEEAVSYGRQAIVLVPEISLTPQTVGRFRSRFNDVAVLHSHLTDADRHAQWKRIASGKVQVVVGARSAVFAPVPHLGMIILDEEHETSFKQGTAPRYHARDVARQRAMAENVPLILGSATPSLESWHRAQMGEYRLVSMPRRIADRPMPSVETVDLRTETRSRHSTRGAIHRKLHMAIQAALDDGGQVILLLNRRGFSTQIQCPACGEAVKCPECEIALTHHRTEEIALCHYCDYQVPAPSICPSCSFTGIRYTGFGTQKLEAEVRARFRNASCIRMDTDTMRGRGAHERALAQFRSGEIDILLGTQMIAKGLDFPNVTLVGVINSDTSLHLPDFRAAERTFHLITQVAGRTGRGERGGRVLIQTFNPEHPAIARASRHDYKGFAGEELPMRKALGYPPYSSMARLVIRGPDEKKTFAFAEGVADRLKSLLRAAEAESRLLGPAPAPLEKLRGLYRFHMQVHSPRRDRLRDALAQLEKDVGSPPEEVQWIIDIDPIDML